MAQARAKATSLPVIVLANLDINIIIWTMNTEQNTESLDRFSDEHNMFISLINVEAI